MFDLVFKNFYIKQLNFGCTIIVVRNLQRTNIIIVFMILYLNSGNINSSKATEKK